MLISQNTITFMVVLLISNINWQYVYYKKYTLLGEVPTERNDNEVIIHDQRKLFRKEFIRNGNLQSPGRTWNLMKIFRMWIVIISLFYVLRTSYRLRFCVEKLIENRWAGNNDNEIGKNTWTESTNFRRPIRWAAWTQISVVQWTIRLSLISAEVEGKRSHETMDDNESVQQQ